MDGGVMNRRKGVGAGRTVPRGHRNIDEGIIGISKRSEFI